jgi:HK97 family phage prohead protease
MSEVEIQEQDTERAERPVLRREFAAILTPGDGRTLDVRIVPYGVAEPVSDDGLNVYREEWVDGAFDEQLVAGHRLKVLMNFEHRSGFDNVIGKGLALRSVPGDGLHGSFRIKDGPAGDMALELANDGILDSVSLEAVAKKSVRTAEGVVRRVKAHLRDVALCRHGAFTAAKVLAIRDEAPVAETILDEEYLPVPLKPELVERCRRLGIQLPQRYQAHPDEPGTPAETGTPEDGTRQTEANANSQE